MTVRLAIPTESASIVIKLILEFFLRLLPDASRRKSTTIIIFILVPCALLAVIFAISKIFAFPVPVATFFLMENVKIVALKDIFNKILLKPVKDVLWTVILVMR